MRLTKSVPHQQRFRGTWDTSFSSSGNSTVYLWNCHTRAVLWEPQNISHRETAPATASESDTPGSLDDEHSESTSVPGTVTFSKHWKRSTWLLLTTFFYSAACCLAEQFHANFTIGRRINRCCVSFSFPWLFTECKKNTHKKMNLLNIGEKLAIKRESAYKRLDKKLTSRHSTRLLTSD